MQSRPTIPQQVSAIIAQIDALNSAKASIEFFTDIRGINYKKMTATLSCSGKTYSFANWIHIAGRQDILDWIYNNSISTSVTDNYYLLHWAVLCRQPKKIIEKLATYQRDSNTHSIYYRQNDPYNTKADDNRTPLHVAVAEGNLEIVGWMLSATSNTLTQENNNWQTTPLHLAVMTRNSDMVWLLLSNGAKPDILDTQRLTPLQLALMDANPDIDIIRYLVSAKANVLADAGFTSSTPVHLALSKGFYAKINLDYLQLKDLAWTNVADHTGITAFAAAAFHNQLEIITECLNQQYKYDNNAAVDSKILPATFSQALRLASQKGNTDVAEVLLPMVTNIKEECADKPGTALSMAAVGKHMPVIRALLRHLITGYIIERDGDDEYKKHTYFFVKKGAGYNKPTKLAAARALLAVVNETAGQETLAAHHGALHNKTLGGIYALVDKFIFQAYQPPVENAREAAPLASAKTSTSRSSASGGGYYSGSRSQGEFEYLNTAAKCCEASACVCSTFVCPTNTTGGGCTVQ